MKIKPFVSAQKIILGLHAETPRAILELLVAPLVKDQIVTDEAAFLHDLEAREAQITTVMDNGVVAIPHARSHAVRRLGLAVGIAPEPGILFSPEPEVRTRLFFCIAVPSFAPAAHIPLLQSLAKFAREANRVEKILHSRTPGAAARYLATFRG